MGWWSDTNSWHNRGLKRLLICTERHTRVIDAFVALAGAILTRRLIRIALTNHRWGTRPARRPCDTHACNPSGQVSRSQRALRLAAFKLPRSLVKYR